MTNLFFCFLQVNPFGSLEPTPLSPLFNPGGATRSHSLGLGTLSPLVGFGGMTPNPAQATSIDLNSLLSNNDSTKLMPPLGVSSSIGGVQEHQQATQPESIASSSAKVAATSSSSPSTNVAQPNSPEQAFMLPSTMVPPTVLASVVTTKSKAKSNKKAKTTTSRSSAPRSESPQDVLMRLVKQQGHVSLDRVKSDDAGYDAMPSPLQLSSFGTSVVQAVHTDDVEMLGKLLSCGLSPNPCNQFRDSIVDLVCKRGNTEIFLCLLEHGCDLRVVDGFGRTPLHHCAWASSFEREIAEAILERDPMQLFIEDKRGQTPLEYIRPSLCGEWCDFLEENAEKFWPKGGVPAKMKRPKEDRPDGTIKDPKNAVSAGLASMISSGIVTPEQFAEMDEATRKSYG